MLNMDLKNILLENIVISVSSLEMLPSRKLSYLIIVYFTKRKLGAHIAMPIKGNVHLLFHNV